MECLEEEVEVELILVSNKIALGLSPDTYLGGSFGICIVERTQAYAVQLRCVCGRW